VAISLVLIAPELMVPLAIFAGLIWLVLRFVRKSQGSAPAPRQPRQETLDDCPQPLFCFHKDKGEHHLRRGKEIDPWDRPDIDISKYQRRQ
jgi:hypothetical protein